MINNINVTKTSGTQNKILFFISYVLILFAVILTSGCTIGSTGLSKGKITTKNLLNPLSSPTVAAGTAPNEVISSPNGKYVYVTNFISDNVSMYSVNETSQ